MKLIIIIVASVLFYSCSEGWTKADEQQFTGGCLKGAFKDMDSTKARSYCDCMLQQLKKRYPNASDLKYVKTDTAIYSLGKQCRQ
ncbi:MAG TPA: hypothetical protein VJ499_08345 [Flavisolibacter sp.]|nr:hypothetical protein [Flavisolibacter sp.]